MGRREERGTNADEGDGGEKEREKDGKRDREGDTGGEPIEETRAGMRKARWGGREEGQEL